MIKNIIALFLVLLFISCSNDKKTNFDPIDFQPKETELYFKGDNFNQLKKELSVNYQIRLLRQFSKYKKLDSLLSVLAHIDSSNKAIISIDDIEEITSLTIIVKSDSTIFKNDSIKNFISESINTKDQRYEKMEINGLEIFHKNHYGHQFFGNNLQLINKIIENTERKTADQIVKKVSDNENTMVFTPNSKSKLNLFSWMRIDSILDKRIADRFIVNFKNSQGTTTINGVTEKNNQKNGILNYIDNTIARENKFSQIIPANIETAISFTFNDIENVWNNIHDESQVDSLNVDWNIDNNIVEISRFNLENDSGLILNTLDAEYSLDHFENRSIHETFRQIDIYEIDSIGSLNNIIKPLIGKMDTSYMFNIDQFIVLSNSISLLKNCITSYQNETTLSKSPTYLGIMKNMSDESSLFIYHNSLGINNLLNQAYSENIDLSLDQASSSGLQFIIDKNFAHINGVFGQKGDFEISKSVSEEIQINIDSEIISNPQFIANHLRGSRDIAIQDVNNVLYLFDNRGKLLFKRKLDGAINGEIHEMDSFGNGRKQLVFATGKTVYAISRSGQDLRNFPIKFRDNITQPLSLFDYDKNKRYRILITQGKELIMLDKSGKRVRGFKFNGNGKEIGSAPKHIRIGSRDYIVFKQGEAIKILSRTGKDRIRISEKFDFSDNDVFEYDDAISFTEKSGELISIKTNGKISKENLNISEDHKIFSTSKTFVSLNDNELKIKSNTVELDFGNYTDPQIFYINNKIYVSTTDLQTNKVYLFESTGKAITGFPIYGNSAIDLANFDKDSRLELIVKNGDSGILVYEVY